MLYHWALAKYCPSIEVSSPMVGMGMWYVRVWYGFPMWWYGYVVWSSYGWVWDSYVMVWTCGMEFLCDGMEFLCEGMVWSPYGWGGYVVCEGMVSIVIRSCGRYEYVVCEGMVWRGQTQFIHVSRSQLHITCFIHVCYQHLGDIGYTYGTIPYIIICACALAIHIQTSIYRGR